MSRQPTKRQMLVQHLDHIFHVGPRLPARPTLVQLQEWHIAAHEHYLPHAHQPTGYIDGRWGRVVDIYLAPPKNPGSAVRVDRNWTLGISKHAPHIVYHLPLAGTHAGDPEGAQKAAAQFLGYEANWEPKGWGYVLKED